MNGLSRRNSRRDRNGDCMDTDNIDKIREKMLRDMMTSNTSSGDKVQVNTKPMELNDRTFTGEVAKHDLMVVDFWAPWCGPCQYVSPIVEELARDYAGKVAFGKLNVDDNPMVSTQFRVMSIPTIMFFKKGRLVDMQIGAVPKQFLDQKIKKHMAQ